MSKEIIMEKKYSRSHIGKEYVTNKNLGAYNCRIIDGGSKLGYCTVLLDTKYTIEVRYDQLKDGRIKNPYHKTVCNIGYFGVGAHKANKQNKSTRVYNIWTNMLKRCYDPETQVKHPTYVGVSVCKEWHNFQNFAEWYVQQPHSNELEWEIDKDLFSSKELKQYSPKTCCLLPKELNRFISYERADSSSGYPGVTWHKRDKVWQARVSLQNKRIHLGCFTEKSKAIVEYKKEKMRHLIDLIIKYKRVLSTNTVEQLKQVFM